MQKTFLIFALLGLRKKTYLAQAHIRKTVTTGNDPRQNVLVMWTEDKTLHMQQTFHTQRNNQTNLDLKDKTLGYGFCFQHRNPRILPIESFSDDSGRTLFLLNTVT
jgi:hypothetical protein